MTHDAFTIGVEEEFFLVDAETRRLAPRSRDVLANTADRDGDQVGPELHRTQVEIGTGICHTLAEVRGELVRLRGDVARSAGAEGLRLAASGTHPFSDWHDTAFTPKEAYLRLARDYQQVAREQLVCGCHVHIGVPDPEEAIQVVNRVRSRLGTILALSVNSPFYCGVDTGYQSYRTELWRRWPMSGTPGTFGSRAEYDGVVETLQAIGAIDEPARLYWDVRPSARFPTVEFRIADVCLRADEAVMVAALVRALAETCHRQLRDGVTALAPRPELLPPATWRAARYGVEGDLADLEARCTRKAREAVEGLLEFLTPALEEHGDAGVVGDLVERTLTEGTGAARQRAAYAQRGSLEDVVDRIVEETTAP
jgi:carboxylate-amine ligase